jgi:hypothetical protein
MSQCLLRNHNRIISTLSCYSNIAEPDEVVRGKRHYFLNKENCQRVFFLTEGDFLLRTLNENKIISIVSAPYVIGATPALEPTPLYLERVDYGVIKSIDYDQFWRVINYNNSHADVMNIIAGHYTDLMNYLMVSRSDAREQVIALLNMWKSLPMRLKDRYSVLYLLSNSSHLSKSTICRILKELKEEGELELENGRFVAEMA